MTTTTASPTKAEVTTETHIRYVPKNTTLSAALSGVFPYGVPATRSQAGPGARAVAITVTIEEIKPC